MKILTNKFNKNLMDNSEKFLIITIFNKNDKDKENGKFEICLNEVKSIEKIKEEYKQSLGLENIDINKINLCFIDEDKDKNIINEFNDLIKYSNINSENNNLSIKLIAEMSEEKTNTNKIDNQNKANNPIYINKNNNNTYKITDDDKDRKIKELIYENEILNMICKKYKDKLKELINKYVKKNHDLKNKNRELSPKNNADGKSQKEVINNTNTKKNDINEKDKDTVYIRDIQFINIKCNKCERKNDIKIFQCMSCKDYYLCQDCFIENNNKTQRFHKHRFLYFFEIIFPKEFMEQIRKKRIDDKNYNEIIDKFNDTLINIFFDGKGNFSNKKYNMDLSHIEKLKTLCNDMNKINEDPLKYFEEYKILYINPALQKIEKEGKQKEIVTLIKEKIQLFTINLKNYSKKGK